MANCALCGGKVSKRNKHKNPVCGKCTEGYVDICPYCREAPRPVLKEGSIFCGRCGHLLKRKPPKPEPAEVDVASQVAKDRDLAERLGMLKDKLKEASNG